MTDRVLEDWFADSDEFNTSARDEFTVVTPTNPEGPDPRGVDGSDLANSLQQVAAGEDKQDSDKKSDDHDLDGSDYEQIIESIETSQWSLDMVVGTAGNAFSAQAAHRSKLERLHAAKIISVYQVIVQSLQAKLDDSHSLVDRLKQVQSSLKKDLETSDELVNKLINEQLRLSSNQADHEFVAPPQQGVSASDDNNSVSTSCDLEKSDLLINYNSDDNQKYVGSLNGTSDDRAAGTSGTCKGPGDQNAFFSTQQEIERYRRANEALQASVDSLEFKNLLLNTQITSSTKLDQGNLTLNTVHHSPRFMVYSMLAVVLLSVFLGYAGNELMKSSNKLVNDKPSLRESSQLRQFELLRKNQQAKTRLVNSLKELYGRERLESNSLRLKLGELSNTNQLHENEALQKSVHDLASPTSSDQIGNRGQHFMFFSMFAVGLLLVLLSYGRGKLLSNSLRLELDELSTTSQLKQEQLEREMVLSNSLRLELDELSTTNQLSQEQVERERLISNSLRSQLDELSNTIQSKKELHEHEKRVSHSLRQELDELTNTNQLNKEQFSSEKLMSDSLRLKLDELSYINQSNKELHDNEKLVSHSLRQELEELANTNQLNLKKLEIENLISDWLILKLEERTNCGELNEEQFGYKMIMLNSIRETLFGDMINLWENLESLERKEVIWRLLNKLIEDIIDPDTLDSRIADGYYDFE